MSKISSRLKEILNPPQVEAVMCVEGPVLVLAGAGTGKTRVITHRIAYMIEGGIPPGDIAGVTFTNKAASEMRERIKEMIPKADAFKVFLGTFHAFCARILRKEIGSLNFTPNFTIADEGDQNSIVRQAMNDCGVNKDEINPNVCISVISREKSNLRTPQSFRKDAENKFDELIGAVYERYMKILENQNMIDFDDILCFTVRIFEERPEVLKKYQDIYKYLLVDEYQDTNAAQFRLIDQLSGKKKNVFVVGDDDQSIYGWRGANIRNILEFPKHFPGCKLIALEQNYRSTSKILHTANSIISRNDERHKKSLWSKVGQGEHIMLASASDEVKEAEFAAKKISEIYASSSGMSYSDFAILYRSNHQSRHFEDTMRSFRIPYRLVGSHSFYERREIRDAIAYLKLAVNMRDDQSFLRIIGVPTRGMGDKAIDELKKIQSSMKSPFSKIVGMHEFLGCISGKSAAEAAKFAEVLSKWSDIFKCSGELYDKAYGFLSEIGYLDGFVKIYKDRKDAEKRRDNVYELLNMISEVEKGWPPDEEAKMTMRDFLEKYCLQDDNDKVKEEENKSGVSLMTVHAAKGLEFDTVFITGMEQNIFPHERSLKEKASDEERRLFYVAVTRARRNLFITWAKSRMKFGERKEQIPSIFLEDLPEECVTRSSTEDEIKILSDEDFESEVQAFFKKSGYSKLKTPELIYYED